MSTWTQQYFLLSRFLQSLWRCLLFLLLFFSSQLPLAKYMQINNYIKRERQPQKKERTQISVSNSGGPCVVKQTLESRENSLDKKDTSTSYTSNGMQHSTATAQHANQLVSICASLWLLLWPLLPRWLTSTLHCGPGLESKIIGPKLKS